jgi:homospermidine synthase
VGKLLFIPFSIAGGLIAGFISKKIFDLAWGLVDDEEPPEPEHRDVPWVKLMVALAVQGAIFRMMRGLADRGSRLAFFRFTGSWPGEEEPDETG